MPLAEFSEEELACVSQVLSQTIRGKGDAGPNENGCSIQLSASALSLSSDASRFSDVVDCARGSRWGALNSVQS